MTMRFFKRKKPGLNARQQALAQKAADGILRVQRRCADYLARRTCYWSRGSKIVALALYILLFGGISIWLLLKAIY